MNWRLRLSQGGQQRGSERAWRELSRGLPRTAQDLSKSGEAKRVSAWQFPEPGNVSRMNIAEYARATLLCGLALSFVFGSASNSYAGTLVGYMLTNARGRIFSFDTESAKTTILSSTDIKWVPGMGTIPVDSVNHKAYMLGSTNSDGGSSNTYLYEIDTKSESNESYRKLRYPYVAIGGTSFDIYKKDTLIGHSLTGSIESIFSFDTKTAKTTDLVTTDITMVRADINVDPVNHKAYLVGSNNPDAGSTSWYLYEIDIKNRSYRKISNPPLGEGGFSIDFYKKDTLIGYMWTGSREQIFSYDTKSAKTSVLVTLDSEWSSGKIVVDPINHKAYTVGNSNLYEIDIRNRSYRKLPNPPKRKGFSSSFDVAYTYLYVVISGIDTDGYTLVKRATTMGNRSTVIRVCKARPCKTERDSDWTGALPLEDPSDQEVTDAIAAATKEATARGGDVVVNIDMDLENYSMEYPLPPPARWHVQTRWAGGIANVVARAFKSANPDGKRILYAHSAGGDAARRSLEFASAATDTKDKKLFDSINIFNGRTSVHKLSSALDNTGYSWWETKIFLNENDCPALPGSLSYYSSAASRAGTRWATFWGYDVPVAPSICAGHNYLTRTIGSNVKIKINLGGKLVWKDTNHTVEDLMNMDWRSEVNARMTP